MPSGGRLLHDGGEPAPTPLDSSGPRRARGSRPHEFRVSSFEFRVSRFAFRVSRFAFCVSRFAFRVSSRSRAGGREGGGTGGSARPFLPSRPRVRILVCGLWTTGDWGGTDGETGRPKPTRTQSRIDGGSLEELVDEEAADEQHSEVRREDLRQGRGGLRSRSPRHRVVRRSPRHNDE